MSVYPESQRQTQPLGISTVRDRVCMTAAMLALDPIFEADSPPEQFAYRQGRYVRQAVIDVEEWLFHGHAWIIMLSMPHLFPPKSSYPVESHGHPRA